MLYLTRTVSAIIGVLLLISSNIVEARVNVIVSVVPPAQEVVVPPAGYMNCYFVPSGFYNGIWVNTHRVCEYADYDYGEVWVAGYWGCNRYGGSICANWYWIPSHWVHHGYREYGIAWHDYYYYHPHYHYRPAPYDHHRNHDHGRYYNYESEHSYHHYDGDHDSSPRHEWHH